EDEAGPIETVRRLQYYTQGPPQGCGLPANQRSDALADGHVEVAPLAAAHDLRRDLAPDAVAAEQGHQVIDVAHRLPVQSDQGVAHQQAGCRCRAFRLDVDQQQGRLLADTLGQ